MLQKKTKCHKQRDVGELKGTEDRALVFSLQMRELLRVPRNEEYLMPSYGRELSKWPIPHDRCRAADLDIHAYEHFAKRCCFPYLAVVRRLACSMSATSLL